MKVEGTSRSTPQASLTASPALTRPQPSARDASGKDNVSISEQSSQLHALESSIKDAPEIDSLKIEAIRQAISEGNFSISSGRVAEKMMAFSREMIAQQK